MNSLIDRLPRDLFTHLFQNSKFLLDVDIYSFAKSSQTILRLIGSKYELQDEVEWSFYRLVDIEALGLKLPWNTKEEKSRYVLHGRSHSQVQSPSTSSSCSFSLDPTTATSPTTPDTLRLTSPDEWVILRHPLERLSGWGYTTLPFNSLMTNEYQHTHNTIGVITLLALSTPEPPRPFISEISSNRSVVGDAADAALLIPKWKDGLIKLPHLRFLPLNTLIGLTMMNICINEMEIIQTYVWPKKLQYLSLWTFNPSLFNESMAPNWPSSLTNLQLYSRSSSAMTLNSTGGRLYFPPNLVKLDLDTCDDSISNEILATSLPKSLTSLACAPKPGLNELKLNELPSLHRLDFRGFNSSIDGFQIPLSVEELKFGYPFDQPIDGLVVNSSLTRLVLKQLGQQLPSSVVFPESLRWLEFGSSFGEVPGQTLFGVKLPEGLQTLKYGYYIDTCVYQPQFTYPSSLTSLELGYQWHNGVDQPDASSFVSTATNRFTLVLPPELKELWIPLHLLLATNQVSTKLERLTITCSAELDHVSDNVADRLNHLFARMNQLHFLEFSFLHLITVLDRLILPNSVEEICMGDLGRTAIKDLHFGSKLQRLHFIGYFNQSLNGVIFPEGLKAIECSSDFNQPLDEVALPSKLESLSFDSESAFNQPINHIKFPTSLKTIQLPSCYNQPLTGLILPPRLERFDLGEPDVPSEFTHIDSLAQLELPASMKWLIVPNASDTYLRHHPNLIDYQAWLTRLQHTHPYVVVRFSQEDIAVDDDEVDEEDDEDEDEDEEEEEEEVMDEDEEYVPDEDMDDEEDE